MTNNYRVREIKGFSGDKLIIKKRVNLAVKNKILYEEFLFNKFRKQGVLLTNIECNGNLIEKGNFKRTYKVDPESVYNFIIENPELDFIGVGYRFGLSSTTVKKYFRLMTKKAPE